MKLIFHVAGISALLASPAASEVLSDIAYGDNARNQLDLYLPDGVKNPPVVVFIHGGRWFRNDKTQIGRHNRIKKVNDAGIAIASINYTFSDEAVWPAQLDDIRTAFDFVRNNGNSYGYDADKIAVWGQSSGAHLALWAAFDLARSEETQLDAVISWYAPTDLFGIIPDRAADDVPDREGMNKEPSPESLLVGAPVLKNKKLADAASPLHFLSTLPADTALPPALLVHGTADFVISPLQTIRLYETMQSHAGSGSVELRLVEGAGHGREPFDAEVAPVVDFLTQTFANKN